jgi:hypothetical protein
MSKLSSIIFFVTGVVLLALCSTRAQTSGPVLYAGVKLITANYSVQAGDQVIVAFLTNGIVTNNLATTGKMVTIISKGAGGSLVITNTLGAIFTFPGLGTNQTPSGVQLGAWNSPSNMWTGVYDGTNW